MKTSRFVLAVCLLPVMLASGCSEDPASTGGGNGAATQPGEPEPAPREPDDPAAVAALEGLGVKLVRDESGSVIKADGTNRTLTEDDLQHLKGLPYLVEIDFYGSPITNDDLAILKDLPQLKVLGLRQCSELTEEGFAHLAHVPGLERLALLYTVVGNESMPVVAGLKDLKVLDLRGTRVGDAGLEHLREHPSLVDLKLRAYSVTDRGMEHIGTITRLRVLEVEDAAVTDLGMPHLAGLDLQKLNLMRLYLDEESMEHLSGMTRMRDLRLRGSGVSPRGLRHLAGSKETLVYLDLTECPIDRIDNDDLEALTPFQNLETLQLWQTALNDDGLRHVGQLAGLKKLNISICPAVTSAGIDHLLGLRRLEELDLSETGIDDEALDTLAALTSLKVLNVRLTRVTPEAVARLRAALPECTINFE